MKQEQAAVWDPGRVSAMGKARWAELRLWQSDVASAEGGHKQRTRIINTQLPSLPVLTSWQVLLLGAPWGAEKPENCGRPNTAPYKRLCPHPQMCECVRSHGKPCAWNQVANQLALRQGDYPSPVICVSPVSSEDSIKMEEEAEEEDCGMRRTPLKFNWILIEMERGWEMLIGTGRIKEMNSPQSLQEK